MAADSGRPQRGVCFRAHGKRAMPSGYKLSRAKAFFWPVFDTESRPTGAPGASRRGKGGFWTVFGTAILPTGTSGPSSRGEGGLLTGLWHGYPAHRCSRGIPSWQRGLLAGLWHGYPAHRCSRGILAWRRGSSFRPLARLPCSQVPNCYPRGVHKQSADG